MATVAQIVANRANAQLSTGPNTEKGKARSSENSFKHGFYSKAFIVRDDEQAGFDALVADLAADLKPDDAILHQEFFAEIVHASWNLHRLRTLENKLYAAHDDPFDDEKIARKLEQIARHRTRFERARRSALQQYRDYTTNAANHSMIPYDLRDMVPTVLDVHSFHRARREAKKIYHPSVFYPSGQWEQAEKEQKERLRQLCGTAAGRPSATPSKRPAAGQ